MSRRHTRIIGAGYWRKDKPVDEKENRLQQRAVGWHRTLSRPGWPDVVFAFHDGEELGPRMLAGLENHTGLKPDDL